MTNSFDRDEHRRIMFALIDEINGIEGRPFVLKGGTALMRCYGLDRFSEDIDLDGPARLSRSDRLFRTVSRWAGQHGLAWRIGKDTPTVKRIFVHYGDGAFAVKIEASLRRREIPDGTTRIVDETKVYSLDELCMQKCSAYQSRDKIRDLYDVTWMCTEHYGELGESAKNALLHAFEYRDFEHFDYMAATNTDPLIDLDRLETRFLESFETLGLMTGEPEEETATMDIVKGSPGGALAQNVRLASPNPPSDQGPGGPARRR